MGDVRLRPVTRDDVTYLVCKQTPEMTAPYNWFGFRSEVEFLRRFEDDGFLGDRYGKLIVLRRAQFRGGAWRDLALYSLVRSEIRRLPG